MEHLEEGIFTVDKAKTKIVGKTEEEVNQKLKEFFDSKKNYNPKASSKKAKLDNLGRFYYEVSFDKSQKEDDPSLVGKLKRGAEVVKKGIGVVKDVISQDQTTLKSESEQELKKQMNKMSKKYDNIHFGKIKVDKDGNFTVLVTYDKRDAKAPVKRASSTDRQSGDPRISNIQKQLSKLSGDQLDKVEKYVNSATKTKTK